MSASQIMTLYLENMNFLIESVDKLKKKINKRLKNIKKLILCQFLQNTFLLFQASNKIDV